MKPLDTIRLLKSIEKQRNNKLSFVVLFLIFHSLSFAQENSIDTFFNDKTKIEKPLELRDPFKAPSFKAEKDKNRDGFSISKGLYTNIAEKKINGVGEIKLVGILIGKERRAMVSAGNAKEIIILKEGMKIGEDGAELKAILPGGIILVEKITNVYGQEEYLETVIPISK